jgi:hypothetical protein
MVRCWKNGVARTCSTPRSAALPRGRGDDLGTILAASAWSSVILLSLPPVLDYGFGRGSAAASIMLVVMGEMLNTSVGAPCSRRDST